MLFGETLAFESDMMYGGFMMAATAHGVDCFEDDETANAMVGQLKMWYRYRFAKRFLCIVFSLFVLIVFFWVF